MNHIQAKNMSMYNWYLTAYILTTGIKEDIQLKKVKYIFITMFGLQCIFQAKVNICEMFSLQKLNSNRPVNLVSYRKYGLHSFLEIFWTVQNSIMMY